MSFAFNGHNILEVLLKSKTILILLIVVILVLIGIFIFMKKRPDTNSIQQNNMTTKQNEQVNEEILKEKEIVSKEANKIQE